MKFIESIKEGVSGLVTSFQAKAADARAQQQAFVDALEKQVEKHGIVAVTKAKNPFDLG